MEELRRRLGQSPIFHAARRNMLFGIIGTVSFSIARSEPVPSY